MDDHDLLKGVLDHIRAVLDARPPKPKPSPKPKLEPERTRQKTVEDYKELSEYFAYGRNNISLNPSPTEGIP